MSKKASNPLPVGISKTPPPPAPPRKKYEGSRFERVGNIAIGCMSEEARDLLDEIMKEWKINYKKLKELKKDYEPSIYAFAYWLVRWSGLIQRIVLSEKIGGEEK